MDDMTQRGNLPEWKSADPAERRGCTHLWTGISIVLDFWVCVLAGHLVGIYMLSLNYFVHEDAEVEVMYGGTVHTRM